MFEAVIVPGVMLVMMMMALTVVTNLRMARQGQGTARTQFALSELARSIPGAIPVLLIPAILDGGIFSGIFTPAESGAVAIVVALGLGFLLRSLRLGGLWKAVGHTVDLSAMIILILAASSVLDYGITTSGVQDQVNSILATAGHSHILFLLMVNAIFIVVHEFLDIAPSILVIVPLVIPGALLVGVSPIQLGVVVAINSTIGAVLPPIGLNLYVAGQLANVSPVKMMRPIFVYILGSFVILALVTAIPVLSTWLPSVLGR
jgi:C4-dicarboxylate transporter DctM subunit